jgi:hypothetical protein
VCEHIVLDRGQRHSFFSVGSWKFCRHLKSGEAVESDGEGRDSGAAIMSRGGKHGDTAALGKMMRTVQGWVDKPLTSAQIPADDEGGDEEDEDDEEEGEVRASGAGAAATQGPLGQERAGGAARQAGSAKDKDAESAPRSPDRLQPSQYGDNTPQRGKRKGGRESDVWKVIKRIRDPTVRQETSCTHVCKVCWKRLKVGWSKDQRCWVTTVGVSHFRASPQCAPFQAERLRAKDDAKKARMTQGSLSDFTLSTAERALTRAAQWYIYGTGRVSKSTFEDDYFRAMTQAYFEAGGGQGEAPHLTIKALSKYINAEFECFLIYVSFLAEEMLEFTEGKGTDDQPASIDMG